MSSYITSDGLINQKLDERKLILNIIEDICTNKHDTYLKNTMELVGGIVVQKKG